MPAVSTSSNAAPPSSTIAETRSRVTPGLGSTIEMRRPAIALRSDDLPTFWRPTMAMMGSLSMGSGGLYYRDPVKRFLTQPNLILAALLLGIAFGAAADAADLFDQLPNLKALFDTVGGIFKN